MEKEKLIFMSLVFASLIEIGDTQCGRSIYDGSGYFSFNTGISGSCAYHFKNQNAVTKITWTTFNVPGKMPDCSDKDYVKVYIGCSINQSYLTTFCSSNMVTKPHKIYGYGGCITLKVKSSGESYFKISYLRMENSRTDFGSTCRKASYYSDSGVIASPSWPNYFHYIDFNFGGECEWDIKTSSSKLIKLSIMDLDIYSSCFTEYLKIKGEKSVLTSSKESKKYCYSKDPFSLKTKYYELEIEMDVSRTFRRKRGFVIGWVAYKDEEASKRTVWGIGVGVAVVVIFVAIVAFCCYRKYKRRQQPSVVQHAYGATTTTVTTNNTAVQPGVKAHPGNYPLQPSYPQQPYPPPEQGYMPQQQIYTSTGSYPQQPQAQAGYSDQAPPPYPGLPVSENQQQTMAPYPPTPDAAVLYPPAASPYPSTQGQSVPYPPPVDASAPPAP